MNEETSNENSNPAEDKPEIEGVSSSNCHSFIYSHLDRRWLHY